MFLFYSGHVWFCRLFKLGRQMGKRTRPWDTDVSVSCTMTAALVSWRNGESGRKSVLSLVPDDWGWGVTTHLSGVFFFYKESPPFFEYLPTFTKTMMYTDTHINARGEYAQMAEP